MQLQDIINGGIYKVFFQGKHKSEFIGDHPALLIRTLKEDEIYIVVPLTTYTKEKMEKARSKGYGLHIISTNSIARIDKLQIIHRTNIKERWIHNNLHLRTTPDELQKVNDKATEYIRLSASKANKEYSKYYPQYQKALNDFNALMNNKKAADNIFEIDKMIIKCKKTNIQHLSKTDISEIVAQYYKDSNISLTLEKDYLVIEITAKV